MQQQQQQLLQRPVSLYFIVEDLLKKLSCYQSPTMEKKTYH